MARQIHSAIILGIMNAVCRLSLSGVFNAVPDHDAAPDTDRFKAPQLKGGDNRYGRA
jgi:hypothetical protein